MSTSPSSGETLEGFVKIPSSGELSSPMAIAGDVSRLDDTPGGIGGLDVSANLDDSFSSSGLPISEVEATIPTLIQNPVAVSAAAPVPARGVPPTAPSTVQPINTSSPPTTVFPARMPSGRGMTSPQSAPSGGPICFDYPYLIRAWAFATTNLGWEDPIYTGVLFLSGLACFFVFGVLGVGIVTLVGYSLIAAGVTTGLFSWASRAKIITPQHDYSPAILAAFSNVAAYLRVGEQLNSVTDSFVAFVSSILSWEDSMRSLKLLAISWLLSNHWCVIFSKGALFLVFLAAFSLPVTVFKFKAQLTSTYINSVAPLLLQLASTASFIQTKVTLQSGLMLFVTGLVLWSVTVSISSWITISSLGFLAIQELPYLRPKQA